MSQNRENEKLVQQFLKEEKGEFSEIRTVLIFGRNSSTYKFAFCHALLQQNAVSSMRYQDIKRPMLDIFIERYRAEKRQLTQESTNFTQALDKFLLGQIDREQLDDEAEKVMFRNVLDAFQNVGGSTLMEESKLFEHDKKSKKIILTDKLNDLLEKPKDKSELLKECENRWSIVEHAWKNEISTNLIYDKTSESFVEELNPKRIAVRSALKALLPYQKGRCFYCERKLDDSLPSEQNAFPDVDHFIPWTFLKDNRKYNVNGVWNLVISCKDCNRGESGKFSRIPDTSFFEKLLSRNLYFAIEHKHALKASILMSLGLSKPNEIPSTMRAIYNLFPLTKWKPRRTWIT